MIMVHRVMVVRRLSACVFSDKGGVLAKLRFRKFGAFMVEHKPLTLCAGAIHILKGRIVSLMAFDQPVIRTVASITAATCMLLLSLRAALPQWQDII
jgi:hypothetical protein